MNTIVQECGIHDSCTDSPLLSRKVLFKMESIAYGLIIDLFPTFKFHKRCIQIQAFRKELVMNLKC